MQDRQVYIYLRRRLASEGIVTLDVTRSDILCVCVRRISHGGEGNAQCSVVIYIKLTCLYFFLSFFCLVVLLCTLWRLKTPYSLLKQRLLAMTASSES